MKKTKKTSSENSEKKEPAAELIAVPKEEVIDTVCFMIKAFAVKNGCPLYVWEEVEKKTKNKNQLIAIFLGNIFKNFEEEFKRDLYSPESEFFTLKQKLLFHAYMQLELYAEV